ncbi:hypothetical protein [Corynebacterium caspium]|uniref:hypothetical protein n=1 Tax=Corynebacterium caspium TaxID=234828 RepID=UPI0003618DDA|nr:hypothetical protein [Corynebacterium caspium]WKD58827.1 hypothetical protein CCASP_02085 [Corynebacterium caspium DSM 44850]
MWTALIIAVLAGIAAGATWNTNAVLSLGTGVVFLLASAVATLIILGKTIALIFKLIPLALVAAAIYLCYRALTKQRV